jgi:Plasmid encoded RepA protein
MEPSQLRDERTVHGVMSPSEPKVRGDDPTPASSKGAGDALDQALGLYLEFGYTEERAAITLARNGHPSAEICARLPNVSAQLIRENSNTQPQVGVRRGALTPTTAMLLERVPLDTPPAIRAPSARSEGASSQLGQSADVTERRFAFSATSAAGDIEQASVREISFQYVPLLQCSFPHADQGELTSFTRRNGWLELTLSTARRDFGLPYGVPARLLTIYCASEAIRTRSPEIYLGDSVNDFLRRLDVPITRGARGSQRIYANQLLRLIHCAVSIDEDIRDANGRTGLHIRQALFAEEARLWWDEQHGVGQGSSLVLSSVLFDSILERSAPLSTNAIRQLRKSPMDLDVYAWLVHRLYNLWKPSWLSWSQLSGQFGHSYKELRYFRRFFSDSLTRVLKVYPQAKIKLTEQGALLMPSTPHVTRKTASLPR